ncbi:MAG: hypothetical protein WBQ86_08430 [Candidatus Binatus sp.]
MYSIPQRRLIVAVLLSLSVSGCSIYRHYEASKPAAVRETEAELSDAGFTTIKLDNADKVGLVEDLPPDEIRSYAAQGGTVYWYYDPDICACVYEGHQNEFDRYKMAQRQQSDTAQYAAQSEDEQVASLNALNGSFFPPPIIWVGGGFFGIHGGDGFGHGGFGHGGFGHGGGGGGVGHGGGGRGR